VYATPCFSCRCSLRSNCDEDRRLEADGPFLIAKAMREMFAVFLGGELPGRPFAGVDAQPRALDVCVVGARYRFAVLASREDDVALGIIGDRKAFLEQLVRLRLARDRVLLAKLPVLFEPVVNGSLGRHTLLLAYLPHRLALHDLLTDRVGHLLAELTRPPAFIALRRQCLAGLSRHTYRLPSMFCRSIRDTERTRISKRPGWVSAKDQYYKKYDLIPTR
jgi:hypothetical protein